MYRVTQKVSDLGWVDLELESSLGLCARTIVTYCLEGWWNISNLSQPNPVRDLLGHPVLPSDSIALREKGDFPSYVPFLN